MSEAERRWGPVACLTVLAFVISLALLFFGGHWMWPVAFFVALFVQSHQFKTEKDKEDEECDT